MQKGKSMRTIGWLARTIHQHPGSSAQDAALVAVAMLVAALLAIEYDIVAFWGELGERQRRVRLEEVLALTAVLAAGIVVFVLRRLQEHRRGFESQLRVEAEMGLSRTLALQDPLTELPNRRALTTALDAAVARVSRDGGTFAFYLLDLNGFKRVNDEHGHPVGDEVLREAAGRFRAAARQGDLVARLGGDEFAVLAYRVGTRPEAVEIGRRLLAALDGGIRIGGREFAPGVAVGAVLCPVDAATAEEVVRRADRAMYRAKTSDGSALSFPEQATEPSAPRRALA
jgi:diguanylate cyclase (GGDEF)-like protein